MGHGAMPDPRSAAITLLVLIVLPIALLTLACLVFR